MARQTYPSQRKIRWSAPAPTQPSCPQARPYLRRRPENTTLHRIVREHLETYLAQAEEADPMGDGVPTHVENEFRSYLRCGMTSASLRRASGMAIFGLRSAPGPEGFGP